AGVADIATTIEVAPDVEDLPWDVSALDTADRLEVTWTPRTLGVATDGPTIWAPVVWQAEQAYRIPARGRIEFDVPLLGSARSPHGFQALWSSPTDAQYTSTWAAATAPSGGGTQPADDALAVDAVILDVSTARITITNNTSAHLWTVDGDGAPHLVLRSACAAFSAPPQTVIFGAAAEDALNPVTIDVGTWAQ